VADGVQAEIERVEKLVVKMQKKNALLAEGDDVAETSDGILNADALADAEEASAAPTETGGAKEPTHSTLLRTSKNSKLIPLAVAIAGAADGPDIVEDSGLQVSVNVHVSLPAANQRTQLPNDASPNDEVKHVDSALEEIKETEEP
jgi:hypothetical protein